ncbi:chondroitinase-B domain-containing protein [Chitinophaga sp. Cy-1792]|uniref:chondroitinase-B domain-containing protein n=1 Tax=Chitinophaga sp. Cy-1792 TaxID=2608339 RepID=UPI00141DA0CD|nr:chondroitinase-B domain-containing protein [Chitinophaga sp. Cy-1792]NIG53920.1 T9SS type A sorting domain-containing protein [Chitinophaga sp. Cy-1792]
MIPVIYTRLTRHAHRWLLLILSVCCTMQLSAATVNVSSLSALQTAINNAVAGDVIILANGVYTASSNITISKQGTAALPITIQAQTIGGVEINGTAGISIASPAKYIIIKGFVFKFNASKATMAAGTSFCRWTRNVFETPGDGENLLLNGSDHEVDYNTFQHKNAMGRFIAVRGSGSQIAQRLYIHHNYFYDQQPQTANGAETLQFGLSGYSLSSSNSIVEYNLFQSCQGENEMISVKSSAVTLRYNTIKDCVSQFTLRHGNFCVVYGNYFLNTQGIRIFGDDHKIYSNYFENCSPGINIGNGDGEVADGAALTSHDRPDRCLIAFNTLVNCATNYVQSGRSGGLGATYTTFVNNIIQGGGPAASIAGPYTNPTWSNNLLYSTNGVGAVPAGTYTTANPLLSRDATGTYHLQTGSPAIDAATGSYTTLNTDMDGQARTGTFDIGADEVSSATVTARILDSTMVGVNGTGIPTGCMPASASADDGNVAANVLDGDTATRWSASGDGQWIQFCLDGITSVSAVKIAFYNGNSRTSTFDILASTDGSSFSTVASRLVSSGTSRTLETFSFTPVSAKYIRIVGHGNSLNAWNSFTEVQIVSDNGCTPVIASADDGNVPANVLDNDLNTRWSANGNGQWIQLCLGSTQSVTGVKIAFVSGTSRTSTFDVKVGNDTSNLTTAATGLVSSGTSTALETFNFSAVSGKYVRIIGHGNSINLWNSYAEVQVITASSLTSADATALSAKTAMVTETLEVYPNPAGAQTTVSFTLKQPARVTLNLYDVSGRYIRNVMAGKLPAGRHTYAVPLSALSGGSYLLILNNEGKLSTGRISRQ